MVADIMDHLPVRCRADVCQARTSATFSFDRDTQNISRRYRDFISILIMSLIAKRFENNETPYTAEEISEEHRIPIRLTNQILYQLQEIHLIHEVVNRQKSEDIATSLPSTSIS